MIIHVESTSLQRFRDRLVRGHKHCKEFGEISAACVYWDMLQEFDSEFKVISLLK